MILKHVGPRPDEASYFEAMMQVILKQVILKLVGGLFEASDSEARHEGPKCPNVRSLAREFSIDICIYILYIYIYI